MVDLRCGIGVARHVRAWIETHRAVPNLQAATSPATCGRGLKQATIEDHEATARHVRAWIETSKPAIFASAQVSPATCGRGLKLLQARTYVDRRESPATCGRGLKQAQQRYGDGAGECRPPRAGVD